MARKKLKHFDEMKNWDHVFEPRFDEPTDLPGTWGEKVILELACGKGFYTLELARRMPDATVVGVDIKGSRLWHGAETAKREGLNGAKFLRTRIEELARYFAEGEVDEIWITFADPHLRDGKSRKRLTSARFLTIYKQLLKPGGLVYLKTDSSVLYEFTKEEVVAEGWEILEDIPDVYAAGLEEGHLLHVKTDYERKFLRVGKSIKYLRLKSQ